MQKVTHTPWKAEDTEVVKAFDTNCRIEYNPSKKVNEHWRCCEHGITIYFKTEEQVNQYAIAHGWYRKEELNKGETK